MGGLIVSLLVISVIVVVIVGLKILFEYIENRKIKFVLKEIEKISKDNNNEKVLSCAKTIVGHKMKN